MNTSRIIVHILATIGLALTIALAAGAQKSELSVVVPKYDPTAEAAFKGTVEEVRDRQCPMSVAAFHEKAGRSQVDSCLAWLNMFSSSSRRVSHCRHASIRTLEERFVSLGACWAFSVQPVLRSVWRPVVLLFPSRTWARPLTQSPELGFGL